MSIDVAPWRCKMNYTPFNFSPPRQETPILRLTLLIMLAVLTLSFSTSALADSIVFSDSGANNAAIQDTVDQFRTAIGGVNNGNAAGPIATGRREINWDGGGDAA